MNILQGILCHRPRLRGILAAITILVAVVSFGLWQQEAEAQDGGTLQYGEAKLGAVSSPTGVVYQFDGATGDVVEVELLGIGGFRPMVTIFDPNSGIVGQNDNTNNTNVISLAVTLSSSGTHTIQVRGRDNANGQFTISLQGTPSTDSGSATGGADADPEAAPTIGQVSPDDPEASYTFALNPSEFTKVTVRSLTPGYSPIVRIEDDAGNIVALLNGQFLSGLTIELPPGTGQLKLIVALGNFTGVAEFGVSIAEGVVDECVVSTEVQAGINIRAGGSDEHDIIGLLLPTDELTAVGQNNGWYQVKTSDAELGWVDGQFAVVKGLCEFLPLTEYPAPDEPPVVLETEEPGPDETEEPDGTPSNTPTNTYTPTDGPSPTSTNTVEGPTATASYTATLIATTPPPPMSPPTFTPTFTPSYTPTTPPPPPTAPPDGNYTLTIPLDSTASVTDFVSYPDGDREDRVSYSVSGMNPNSSLPGGRARLILSVSCFGTNTNQVTFFTGGQTYLCGQTIFDREVTADSDTGSVLITAVGGEGTYVQWVLTGTATRVN